MFDPGRPHFVTWLRLHDRDSDSPSDSTFEIFEPVDKSDAAPLYYAALCGFYDLTEYLITEHQQDVNARGGYLVTPLGASLVENHLHVAQLLFNHGADVDVRGYWKRTLLYSASKDSLDIVQWLLDHSADANVREDYHSATPVFRAARSGYVGVVRILVKYNADINARDNNGQTPLHVASQYGLLDVVRFLLGHGVDVNARNNNRSTPLHTASKRGILEVVSLLLERGADVGAEDNEGKTAFQLASAKGRNKVARLLSDHGAK
jgi:ankyrin repeat protein